MMTVGAQSAALAGTRLVVSLSWDTEADLDLRAEDVWTTPDAGPAYLWVVLRDSRGGVALAGYAVTIAP